MRPTSEYSAIGSSWTVTTAAPRREERACVFSSSAMLGSRWVELDARELGDVMLLLPFAGEMVGDLAGLCPTH